MTLFLSSILLLVKITFYLGSKNHKDIRIKQFLKRTLLINNKTLIKALSCRLIKIFINLFPTHPQKSSSSSSTYIQQNSNILSDFYDSFLFHPRAIILHHFHAMMLSKVIIFKQAIIILPFFFFIFIQAFIIFYSRMEIILKYSIAYIDRLTFLLY